MTGSEADQVASFLLEKRLRLAVAESCTGGMLSAELTRIPGASRWFRGGFIVYSDDLKRALAGVDPGTLLRYGAVSRNVALELADGVRRECGSDLGVGITGIAGPGGGSSGKPVGTVHVAVTGPSGSRHRLLALRGDREGIRREAVRESLIELLRFLRGERSGDV